MIYVIMSPSLWLIFSFLWCFLMNKVLIFKVVKFLLFYVLHFLCPYPKDKDILLYYLLKVLNVGFWNDLSNWTWGRNLFGLFFHVENQLSQDHLLKSWSCPPELHLPWHLLWYISAYICINLRSGLLRFGFPAYLSNPEWILHLITVAF